MQSQSGSIHSPHRIRNIIMKEWKKSRKFHLGNSKMQQWDKTAVHLLSARTIQIHIRSKRWRTNVPRDGVRGKVLLCVILSEELHPENGEDVDDDEEDEGEVAEGPKGGDDDAEKNLHGGPWLGQLQNTHLKQILSVDNNCRQTVSLIITSEVETSVSLKYFILEKLKDYKTIRTQGDLFYQPHSKSLLN